MKTIIPKLSLCLVLASVSASSFGAVSGALGEFKLTGFISAGMSWTSADYLPSGIEPIYISYIGKTPSYDDLSNVGIQITKYLRDDINITTQLYAEAASQFDVEAAWAFIEYEPNNNWQFRIGRVRTNPYMLSNYVNVGYAYPWARPPQEVYSQIPFSNFTGMDARYTKQICNRDLSIYGFYGSSTDILTFPVAPFSALLDNVQMKLRHLGSFDIRYGDDTFSVRFGYESTRAILYPNAGNFMQNLNTFVNTMIAMGFLGTDYENYFSFDNAKASFMGIGYQFDWKNIVSMGELVKRKSASPIMANVVGWYLMGGYRVKQVLPHLTFARERLIGNYVRRFNALVNLAASTPPPLGFGVPLDTIAQALIGTSPYYEGGAGDQTSVTAGLRWDIYDGVAIKFELSHVHPDRHGKGLFDFDPQKSVNVYSFVVDAVM